MDILRKGRDEMFEIIKNKGIKITKGDSAAIKVNLVNEKGEPYDMQTGDKLTMTVRKNIDSPVLMQINSTSNILDLTPSDTKNLEVGSCCFDIQLNTSAGDVFTVVGLDCFVTKNMVVIGEVTD